MSSRSEAVYCHPIRDLPIISYAGDEDCIAFIGDGRTASFPYFRAGTREEAETRAENWRQNVIEEYEEALIERRRVAAEASEKRAAKRKGKA